MSNQLRKLYIKPIGFVVNDIKNKPESGYDWRNVASRIEIEKKYETALEGLENYSHIIVVYWLHKVDIGRFSLKVHPKGDRRKPLVGLFASRSPYRPNPIGQKVVKQLKRQCNILWIEGLDAINGTPIIDIKPYIQDYDSPDDTNII